MTRAPIKTHAHFGDQTRALVCVLGQARGPAPTGVDGLING